MRRRRASGSWRKWREDCALWTAAFMHCSQCRTKCTAAGGCDRQSEKTAFTRGKMEETYSQWPQGERRSGTDRRAGGCRLLSRYWLAGKRGEPRRKEDRERSYRVDRHHPRVLVPVALILLLSLLDAVLTLHLIGQGAAEINPLLNYFLTRGHLPFLIVKYGLTASAILIVVYNAKVFLFRSRIRTQILLAFFILPFFLVVQWELFLIFF